MIIINAFLALITTSIGLGNRNKTSWGVLAPSMTIMMMMRMTRKFEQYRIDVDGMKNKKTASASGSYDNVAALDEPRREMHRLLIGMRTVFLSESQMRCPITRQRRPGALCSAVVMHFYSLFVHPHFPISTEFFFVFLYFHL